MHGKDLNGCLSVESSGKTHVFHERDLPLALSLKDGKRIQFSREERADTVAWLSLDAGRIQFHAPSGVSIPVRYNNAPIGELPVTLKDGDFLKLDDVIFRVSEEDGTTIIRLDQHSEDATLLFPVPQHEEATANPDSGTPPSAEEPEPVEEPVQDAEVNPQIRPIQQKGVNWSVRLILAGVFLPLLVGLVFVFTASSVEVQIDPAPDDFAVGRFPMVIKMGQRFLAVPGQHRVQAEKAGYRDLNERASIGYGDDPTLQFTMVKLPGKVTVQSEPVDGAEVYVDGTLMGVTPLTADVEAGNRQFRFLSDRYLPHEHMMEVEGMGREQSLRVTLEPGWGTLQVETVPDGAEVLLDGVSVGTTPLVASPMAGIYTLSIQLDEYKEASREVEIQPGQTIALPQLVLEPLDGRLSVQSDPAGTNIMLNGKFLGTAPGEFLVPTMTELELQFMKGGFKPQEQVIELNPGATKSLNVKLDPEFGTVYVTSHPADSELYVDGVRKPMASQRLRLSTVPHVIEVRKDGYETQTIEVTPTPGLSRKLEIRLETLREVRSKQPIAEIRTSEGQLLREIRILDPVTIDMGASRRESGRQSNEVQYKVSLTRSFFVSTNEVTNGEFSRFDPKHDSGNFQGHRLNRADQPVVNVTWDQAAKYLNWLSQRDGLEPAYVEKDGKMVPVDRLTDGYRLPTEAEWAFVSRYEGDATPGVQPIKYSWGNERNPPTGSGNFAGTESVNGIPIVIQSYRDKYPVSAPVGEFSPNRSGIADMGGNVSEWCHDYYDLRLTMNNPTIPLDPTGPVSGRFHVIRGSSWRHGGIKELRLTYRDYAEEGRNDLGFRIARYASE